ncbi:hypothetical protein BDR07DRAFT_1434056 [Suillus spraguei]|nr:hypothetical protein BDR07DRAFT_1434056 [Suillus spraguei]
MFASSKTLLQLIMGKRGYHMPVAAPKVLLFPAFILSRSYSSYTHGDLATLSIQIGLSAESVVGTLAQSSKGYSCSLGTRYHLNTCRWMPCPCTFSKATKS